MNEPHGIDIHDTMNLTLNICLALRPFDVYMDLIDLTENAIVNYTLFWFGTLIGSVENKFPIQRFFLLVKCVEYSSFDWIITFDFCLKHQFLTFELGGINCIFTFQGCVSSLKILFISRFPTFGTMHEKHSGQCIFEVDIVFSIYTLWKIKEIFTYLCIILFYFSIFVSSPFRHPPSPSSCTAMNTSAIECSLSTLKL